MRTCSAREGVRLRTNSRASLLEPHSASSVFHNNPIPSKLVTSVRAAICMAFDAEQVERALRLTCSERSAADEGTILSWAKRVKLPEEVALEQLVVSMEMREYSAMHSVLFRQGDEGDSYYLVFSGEVGMFDEIETTLGAAIFLQSRIKGRMVRHCHCRHCRYCHCRHCRHCRYCRCCRPPPAARRRRSSSSSPAARRRRRRRHHLHPLCTHAPAPFLHLSSRTGAPQVQLRRETSLRQQRCRQKPKGPRPTAHASRPTPHAPRFTPATVSPSSFADRLARSTRHRMGLVATRFPSALSRRHLSARKAAGVPFRWARRVTGP